MGFKKYIIISFICCFTRLDAQTCCSGGIPLSNNIGLPILEKGSILLGIHYDFNNLNTLNNGRKKLDDNARLRVTHSVLLNASYAITNNLSVESLLTWVNQRREISQFGNQNLDQTTGLGDGVFLLKYNLPQLFDKSDLSVGIGTKIPLGSSTESNDQGITLNADLQPGSNAWDLILWSQYSKSFNFRPSLTLSSKGIYRSTGTNNSYLGNTTYKFGNEFLGFVSFSDQFQIFKSLANPSITFKYRNANLDKIGGHPLDNTGGHWVFIIPNLSIDLSPTIAFSTKAELPLYSNVDGTQLTPTYRITSGILIKLIPKMDVIKLN